jgi:membrane associated rhomboid family serine protease
MLNRNDFQNGNANINNNSRISAISGVFKSLTFIFDLFFLLNLCLFLPTILALDLRVYSICTWPIFHKNQYYRLITHHFFHINLIHILFNMIFFYFVGRNLEKKIGSVYFFMTIICSMIFISFIYLIIVLSMNFLTVGLLGFNEYNYDFYCSIGFSGILFSIFYVQCNLPSVKESLSYFFGLIPIKSKYSPLCYIVLIQVLNPKASFLGHLAGICCGYLIEKFFIHVLFPRKGWIVAFEEKFNRVIMCLKDRLNYITVDSIKDSNHLLDLNTFDKGVMDLKVINYLFKRRQVGQVVGGHINLRDDSQEL